MYIIKFNADGSLDRYKARLGAEDYIQTQEIDYQKTFALVAKMNTVHVLLSLSANFNWYLQQFDVDNAFFAWQS